MEHHELWIVTLTNKLLGPAVAAALASLGYKVDPAHAIPDYLVMCGIIFLLLTALSLFVRSRLSVENPGKLQILLEDFVGGLIGIITEDTARRACVTCRSSAPSACSSSPPT